MNPTEYRIGCERTVCDHNRALQRLQELSPNNLTFGLRLLHATMGMSKEAGEVHDLLEKAIFFNQELNTEKILDECGDILWYMSLALNTLGQSFEEVMKRNDLKLRARFPSKYQDELAANKDRAKEEKAQRGLPLPGAPYPEYPCCEGVQRLEIKPGDASTLVGGHCPVHGYTYYHPKDNHCTHLWNLEKKFDDGSEMYSCVLCGIGKLKVPNHPKEKRTQSMGHWKSIADTAKPTTKTEPCCKCGEDYPAEELQKDGHIYCAKCRAIYCETKGGEHEFTGYDPINLEYVCRKCGYRTTSTSTPKEVTEAEAHCNHNWTIPGLELWGNYKYCTKCNLRKP